MRAALIITATGEVKNIIRADATFQPPKGYVVIEATADATIGGRYSKGKFLSIPQDAAVPQAVSAMQAKVALLRAGLLPTVEQWIAAADDEIKLVWNTATTFNRNSELIASAAQALGLKSETVDNLFIRASQINP